MVRVRKSHIKRIAMLDSLKDMINYDVLFFLHYRSRRCTQNRIAVYINSTGEQIGGSELGPEYTVVLFKFNEERGTYEQ
jgi:hypothetical protein